MKIQVYADVLFIINFCMNLVVLCVCKRLLSCGGKRWRIAVSAAVGGVYSVCVFFPDISFLYTFILKAAVSAAMVWFSFPTKSAKAFFLRLGTFYLASFVLGGACMALMYMTDVGGKTGAILKNGAFYMQLPFRSVILASVGAYLLIISVSDAIKRIRGRRLYDVTIRLGENIVASRGMVDTGNSLTEPVTKRPVPVAQWSVVSGLLPAGCTKDNFIRYVPPERIKLIPCKSAGKENGVMWAVRADEMSFADKVVEKPLVGIYEGVLSEEYGILLHRGFF
jgi:stage II sporulation protein GA (sporulation sigma-E factor processing peptidase)